MNQIASAVSSIATSGSGQGFNYAAVGATLEGGVRTRRALAYEPATIDKVNHTVNVVGSVLTGAAAGAALGPVGAAVGAVAGLLGGLLGGRGGDSNGRALAQLSTQIAQMEQHVLTGLQQLAAGIGTLSQQISDLSQQIDRDFAALSAQVVAFQEHMEKSALHQLRNMIAAEARSTVANIGVQMIENARSYDEHYRGQRLGTGVLTNHSG